MLKTKQKICYFTLLLIFLTITNVFGQGDKKVFIMVHFEAGRDTTHPLINEIVSDELGYPPDSLTTNNLIFQRVLWPSVVDMVQIADSFNIKLTLALQSQMAEYILRDTNKINTFNSWVQNGHELAMHHHGVNHVDWGGYTNRFQGVQYSDDYMWLDQFQNSGLYRGNMQQSFNYLQQLATEINDSIVTGCITDTQIDKPSEIIYLTKGGEEQADLIASPDTVLIPNNPLCFLSHFQVVSVFKDSNKKIIEDDNINHQKAEEALGYVMSKINQIDDDEIMGIVFHAFDYYRFPDIYRDLFSFFNQNQVYNKSIKRLMDNSITDISNNSKVASKFFLMQNYPNPFNPNTTINFSIPHEGIYSLKIYNSLGEEVETLISQEISRGNHSIKFNAKNLSSGLYIYRLAGNGINISKKMILLR